MDVAAAGLERIEGGECDLGIRDVKMNSVGRLGVLRRIRSTHPEPPGNSVSGKVGDQIVENARNVGSSDLLGKPIPKKAPPSSITLVLNVAVLSCRR